MLNIPDAELQFSVGISSQFITVQRYVMDKQ